MLTYRTGEHRKQCQIPYDACKLGKRERKEETTPTKTKDKKKTPKFQNIKGTFISRPLGIALACPIKKCYPPPPLGKAISDTVTKPKGDSKK